jgi:secondary thiamine-phosphate synthase enzyme
MNITIATTKPNEVIDITDKITREVVDFSGLVSVFVLHTTAAITTADLDPGTDLDLLEGLTGMLPDRQWRHQHNPEHAPAHILSSIVGPGVVVPVTNGQLVLGTWQRIVLVELDGPKERNIEVSLIGSQNADPNLML